MAPAKQGNIFVTKRNGDLEPVDVEKFNRVAEWACEGLSGVSASELAIKTQVQFYDKIKTIDLMNATIKSAAELISEEAPNYQFVAARLINYHLRKEVYNNPTPIKLLDHVKNVVDIGFYDKAILDYYDESEWKALDAFIDHDRDFEMTYAAMEQLRGKYLVKNRVTGDIFETPQMAYILIAATLFSKYPKESRLKWIKEYYDAISTHWISLPTPVMAGVRTPQKQFSSCVLINVDDSLDSISASGASVISYISRKAGIGLNVGRIRAVGSKVRNGDAYHTGIVPFIKLFQATVKSCNQGGIRSAAATLYYPFWHYEFEDLIVLKNSKGIEDNRARHLDYSVQFNKLAYERLLTGGNITLLSPADVPGLYEAFTNDQELFKKLYEEAESNPNIRKKTIKALDLFTSFMQERKNTGRIYMMNIDHANTHSSFDEKLAPIEMSNLCAEITLPNKPMGSKEKRTVQVPNDSFIDFLAECMKNDTKLIDYKFDGSNYHVEIEEDASTIALCTLSAINWGKVREPKDFEKPCALAIRALDALLDYQDYPVKAAERHSKLFRPLGVGIIGFAHWMAKNNLKYSDDSALQTLDEYTEAWSYYLTKASIDLAKEYGACDGINMTKYSKGILPIDSRKKEVDELVEYQERLPWNKLRDDLKTYGIRNSTLMAVMPAESSATVANETNGIEPVRSLISIKQSKDGVLKQVVPEYRRLKNKYELLWDQKSPEGYIKISAILQKYVDQTISSNISYNPEFYKDNQLPMSDLIKHMLMSYKYGLKTWYYMNTYDGQEVYDSDKQIKNNEIVDESTVDYDESEADCDSCKL
jgi:ribonucleoside-diphosphate reductase alpha chain